MGWHSLPKPSVGDSWREWCPCAISKVKEIVDIVVIYVNNEYGL